MHTANAAKHDAKANMMLSQPLPLVITKMAVPSIIAFLISAIYNLADTYFVSSLGTNATAAVSVNGSLDQIIMIAGSMLAVGASSYISRLLGAQKRERASKVLSVAFYSAVLFGTVIMVLGILFMHPVVRLLGATDTCEQYSIDYATYVLLVAPFMAGSFVMNQCLRAEGNAFLSMIGMGFGGILNCALDPIFIFVLDMGVAGASIATAISKFVSFSILIFPYITRRSTLRLSLKNFRPDRQIMKEIISVGSSSMFRSGMAVIAAIIINNIAGEISDSVLAGIGVTNRVMMFPFGIILGFGTGFQPVVGFNWGAQQYKRVRESYRFASLTAIIGAAVMGLGLGIFANQAILLFAKKDPAMQEIGALCIRLQCLALPIHAWVAVVNMLCAGLGRAKYALILSTARQGTCFLPIVYPMTRLFGAIGAASVQSVADILSLFLALPIARKTLKQIRSAEAEQEEFTKLNYDQQETSEEENFNAGSGIIQSSAN